MIDTDPAAASAADDFGFREAWTEGIEPEIAFWRNWFATKGSEWPEDYESRLDEQLPLQPYLEPYLPASTGGTVRILDVGSGPLTFLGKQHASLQVDITAVDALADAYNRVMAEAGVQPPVPVEACESERLTEKFQPGTFDIAYARNTLDHSYDPAHAVEQMIECVRPGGYVILDHYQNEAETENYTGLHQWNIEASDDEIAIWRPGSRIDLVARLDGVATLVDVSPDGGMQRVVLQRNA
jgi:SAM-dependent methyltransferase